MGVATGGGGGMGACHLPPDSEFRANSLLEIVIFKEKNSECMPKF